MRMDESMEVDTTTGPGNEFEDTYEEGELSPSNRIDRKMLSSVVVPVNTRTANNQAKSFITGVDIFSKEAQVKAEERARRFGLSKDTEKSILKDADSLYASLGINENSDSVKNYRLNVLHVYGVENLTTKDIFKYFEDYAPASVEWVNDISCNVVWLDKESAARALLGLSKKILGVKKENKGEFSDEDSDADPDEMIVNGKLKRDENSINIKDIRYPLPPGIWRKGQNFMNSSNIFMRFATNSDRKAVITEPISENLKKQVNPETGVLKGILTTSRKRAHREARARELSPPSSNASPFVPPTNGAASKNPWGSLSKNWGVTDFVEEDYLPKLAPPEPALPVRDRLGYKRKRRYSGPYNPNVIEVSDDEDDDDYEYEDDYENDDYYENEYGPKKRIYGQKYKDDYDNDSNSLEYEEEEDFESSGEDESWFKRNKLPRMRMHADDEEERMFQRKRKIRSSRFSQNVQVPQPIPIARDLRKKLVARRKLPPPQQEPIKVIVTNPIAIRSNFDNIIVTEDEQEEEEEIGPIVRVENDDEEEGEIIDDSESESDNIVEYENDDDEEMEEDSNEASEDDDSNDEENSSESDGSSSDDNRRKQVRGPKGSVIKVIPPKPRLQSTVATVLSRIDHKRDRHEKHDRHNEDRHHSKRDLRETLRKNESKKIDLRSRIGNIKRERSPLRIELRNDKYSSRRRNAK